MDFGIVTAKIDEIGFITHAENLGYSHCWITDSQVPSRDHLGKNRSSPDRRAMPDPSARIVQIL